MVRPLRIEFDGAWYHVMNRGLEKRDIFRDDADRSVFFELLGEISETFALCIHAYSLMDNHYHLLVETPHAQLGRAMRHLNGVYTQRFNRRWRRDGPLFRGRYKALLADETRLFELIQYIHLNPVAAGMTQSVDEHPWTSHHAYLHPAKRPAWLMTTALSKALRCSTDKFRKHSNETRRSEAFIRLKDAIEDGAVVLGRKGFQEWLYQNHVPPHKKTHREFSSQQKRAAVRPTVKDILGTVATVFNTSVGKLITPSRHGKREDRAFAAYFLRSLAGLKQEEIARRMNFTSAYASAQVLHRMKCQLRNDPKLNRIVTRIHASLLSTVKT